jgi:carboxymethylenebutenolidase
MPGAGPWSFLKSICKVREKIMAEEIKKLVEEYRDGRISRREFIQKAVLLTGSLAAATSLIDSLLSPPAYAAQVDPNDPGLKSSEVQYPGKAGAVFAYLTRPSSPGKYPAIIAVHRNEGLDDHTRDVARRLAKERYVVLAPDLLSRHGGTAKVNPKGGGLSNISDLAPTEAVSEEVDAGFAYLRSLPEVQGDRLGLIGFCWGGDKAFIAATRVRGLRALVIYYGTSPQPSELVKNIEAPVLAHYGEKDAGVNRTIPAAEEAMKKYDKSFTYKIYPGAGHNFNHDGRPDRYNPEAAKEAWGKTVEFFKKNLQS